ncbi:hypothetical protein [Alkaliphilus metalliredigens]|uniref:hypothetical protein n=1 Tax=Alkaliphilus metalliredigens TaxID=208226 RepID=UPI00059EDD2A|nr:hypothetical protein [Alkaliphilus metalliredigens]
MKYKQHDINGKGFYVDPELLAHDLAILKISKSEKLKESTNEFLYYQAYIEALHDFRTMVDGKIRYDSTISVDNRAKTALSND